MNTNEIIKKKDELTKERQDIDNKMYDLRVEQNTINREISDKRTKIKDIDMAIEKLKIMKQERVDEIRRYNQLYWDTKE